MKPPSLAELGESVMPPIILPGYSSTPDGAYRGPRTVISIATGGRPLESPSSSLEPKNVQVPRGTASPPRSTSQRLGGSLPTSTWARPSSGTQRAIPALAWPATTISQPSPRTWAFPTARSRPDAAARFVLERYFDSDPVLGHRFDEVGVA